MAPSLRPCASCANATQVSASHWRCDAARLRDPEDRLSALPTRTGCVTSPASAYAWPLAKRRRDEVSRWMSAGPVESFIVGSDGARQPFAYQLAPCPAWTHR